MGEQYNFKINPKLPSQEEIARHKDFDALLARFRAGQQGRGRRVARIRRLYVGTAIAAAIAAVAILLGGVFTAPEAPELTAEAYFEQQPYVQPPVQSLAAQLPTEQLSVSAKQGGIYEFPNGARMVIPSTAFADDYGNMIEGEVNIYYREIHDHVDLFLAGIPMEYDSAGQRFQLGAAGMVEIYALQNGQRVNLAPGKTIDVELVSNIYVDGLSGESLPNYGIYQLDTASRNWTYQGSADINVQDSPTAEMEGPLAEYKRQLLDRLQDIENRAVVDRTALDRQYPQPVAPLRPERVDGKRPTLELNFLDGSVEVDNGGLQQELAQLQREYAGVIWQVSKNSPSYDQRALSVAWESVSIRPANNKEYELTLIHPDNQLTLIVFPALTGSSYDRAMVQYESDLAEYEQALAEREQAVAEQVTALDRSVAAQRAAVLDAYQTQLDALKAQGVRFSEAEAYRQQRQVTTRFEADNLGVWQCAHLLASGEQQPVMAAFRNQFGDTYRNHTLYVARKGQNTLYRYYANGQTELSLVPDEDYLFWVIDDKQQVATLSPDDFQWPKDIDELFNYQLHLKDQKLNEVAVVERVLGF